MSVSRIPPKDVVQSEPVVEEVWLTDKKERLEEIEQFKDYYSCAIWDRFLKDILKNHEVIKKLPPEVKQK